MRIGEIADITGLSISNIRFYEKKGLIGPNRDNDNMYRNYTEEDLERLKLIILFRKMDLSVETIGNIFSGKTEVREALQEQIGELEMKKETLQSSIDLCRKVVDEPAALSAGESGNDMHCSLDVDYLLSYVKEEESQGRFFEQIDDLLEDFSYITATNNKFFSRGMFPRYWMYQAVKIFWCSFMILLPLVAIACAILDENGINLAIVVILTLIILTYVVSLFVLYKKKKKQS